MVRKFGFILSGVLFTFGAIAFFLGHRQYLVEWPLAFVILFLNFFVPKVISGLYQFCMLITAPISWVLLRLILGAFYYLILSPVGLAMRFFGRDILDEKIDREASSYWKKRAGNPAREQYERLF